jgi:hypothetical protein
MYLFQENEFPYFPKKRAYLKSKLSMSDESITQIFTNPNEFVLHLSTQSRFLIHTYQSLTTSVSGNGKYNEIANFKLILTIFIPLLHSLSIAGQGNTMLSS